MTGVKWTPVPDDWLDERPIYGPPCPGPQTHRWGLLIDAGGTFLGSGCEECDAAFEFESLSLEIHGHLEFDHDHLGRPCPNFMQFIGQCDCNWWWQFVPEPQVRGEGGRSAPVWREAAADSGRPLTMMEELYLIARMPAGKHKTAFAADWLRRHAAEDTQ